MKTLFKLAFRNVFRYKRRTIITFSAISFGLGLMIAGFSLYKGIDKQSFDNIINSQTAHLNIFAKGYFEKKDDIPLEITIDQPQKIKSILKNIKEIQALETRILFAASLIKGLDELPCLGVAVETEADPLVFNIKDSLKEGNFLEASDQKIIIGSSLAKDLGLKVGDMCVLRMFISTEDYVWNALDIEIKGIFETENPVVNRQTIFIPLPLAQESLSLRTKSTEIVVRLKDKNQLSQVKTSIQSSLASLRDDYEVKSFEEMASDFVEVTKMKTRGQSIILLVMLLIATLGIVNTMLMAVMERTREIGMLAAMGMRKLEVMLLFIFEGALIGFFGSLMGCIIGGLGGWYLEVKGYDMSFLGEEFTDIVASMYPIKGAFYGDLTIGILLFTLIFGIAVSIVASLYPAYKAVKLDPIKALRHV